MREIGFFWLFKEGRRVLIHNASDNFLFLVLLRKPLLIILKFSCFGQGCSFSICCFKIWAVLSLPPWSIPFPRCILQFRQHNHHYNFLQDIQHGKADHVYADSFLSLILKQDLKFLPWKATFVLTLSGNRVLNRFLRESIIK